MHTAYCVVEKKAEFIMLSSEFPSRDEIGPLPRDTLPTGEYRQWQERSVCQPACFGRHCAISKVTRTDRFPEGAFSCSGD